MEVSDEKLREVLRQIDMQIEAKNSRPPPGDRRRTHGQPPQGMSERRCGIDRRYVNRLPLREKERE